MNSLIDLQKKAIVLKRIHEGKPPLCAMKPESEGPMKEVKKRAKRKQKRVGKVQPVSQIDQKKLDNALYLAVVSGDCDKIRKLVKEGANVNCRNSSSSFTALIGSAYHNQLEAMKLLIRLGADLDSRDVDGATALMWTAMRGYPKAVELLIKRGAKLNLKDGDDRTALACASDKCEEILRKLGAKE